MMSVFPQIPLEGAKTYTFAINSLTADDSDYTIKLAEAEFNFDTYSYGKFHNKYTWYIYENGKTAEWIINDLSGIANPLTKILEVFPKFKAKDFGDYAGIVVFVTYPEELAESILKQCAQELKKAGFTERSGFYFFKDGDITYSMMIEHDTGMNSDLRLSWGVVYSKKYREYLKQR